MDSPKKVLSVGGAGRLAGMVVPELAKRGVLVRAMVRNETEAKVALARGAHETVIADLLDVAGLDAAVRGVDGVFHIGPAFAVEETQMGINMVEAARHAGVRKFVFSSVIHPTNTTLENHASKIAVESAVYGSDMEYTILHPANVFQNFIGAWQAIVATGVYAEPNTVDRPLSRVDYRDVAEVAAMALTDDRLAFGTFELCSASRLTRREIGEMAARALGRPVRVVQVGFDEWAQSAKLPYDERELTTLAHIHEHLSKHGMSGNALVLTAILGRPPRSMAGLIQELAAIEVASPRV